MKKFCIAFSALLMAAVSAAEVYIDGEFNDFKRQWTLSTTRRGVVEVVRVGGVNYVQIASENNPKGQIGIYTGRGIAAKIQDKIAVSADIKGGMVIISIMEYGNKKFLGSQDIKFKPSASKQTFTAEFTVKNPKTDLVRISFKTVKGAVGVVSKVKAIKGEK